MAPPDVLIRGAGPVGCALAQALRPSGLRVAILAGSAPRAQFRPLALSHASRLILERLGLWAPLQTTPIRSIRVTQAGAFGRVRLEAAECGVAALGYVTEYAAVQEAMRNAVADLLVAHESGEARCVVHAEGWSGQAHETRYAQDALVARVRVTPPAQDTALERFTPYGPLAMLPLAGDYAVIWSTSPERCRRLADGGEAGVLSALAEAAGPSVGTPVAVLSHSIMPLAMRVRPARTGERAVYIGNAAQTLHPVAGQGLNLGLRDAWELAQALGQTADPGDPRTLAAYARARRLDAGATIRSTDLLARMFLGSGALQRAARGIALSALDILPAPRRFFSRRMIFGASGLP